MWLEGVCKQSELKSGNKEDAVYLTSIYHLVRGEQELCVKSKTIVVQVRIIMCLKCVSMSLSDDEDLWKYEWM